VAVPSRNQRSTQWFRGPGARLAALRKSPTHRGSPELSRHPSRRKSALRKGRASLVK
ncbi:hypothetical protein HispidOSU_018456, partial [Sigmodon hispidus]